MTYPWPADSHGLQVGDLLVDLRYRRVVTAEGSVELQQRVFDLLLLLMSEPNKLFLRNELFDRLWAGIVVDDANLSQSIWLLRKALGESRREWIRTVAKRGYLFQPPAPVLWHPVMPTFADDGQLNLPVAGGPSPALPPEPLISEAEGEVGTAAATLEPMQVPLVEPQLRRRHRHRPFVLLAITVVALGMLASLFWWLAPRAQEPVPIALVQIEGQSGNDVSWASVLLRQWLGWKLGQLPQVRLLSGDDLATGKTVERPAVVMLSAARNDNGRQVIVRARLQQNGDETVMEASGAPEAVPALVDKLSTQLMARLVPGHEKGWPALDVDAATAQRYPEVVDAYEQGDWLGVEQRAPALLTSAPRFGLMHTQLAVAQSHLGESAQAVRQLEIASKLLQPLPDVARQSLQALRLEVDPRRTAEAERALKSLVDAYPTHLPYRQRYIGVLTGTGKYRDALAQLDALSQADSQVTGDRIRAELQYADVYYALGQGEQSRTHARNAEAIAKTGGGTLRSLRVEAALLDARATALMEPLKAAPAYRRAAQLAAELGLKNAAEYADILADLHANQAGDRSVDLRAALDRARKAGALGLEADILVTLANVAPDPLERLQWLQQALQPAQAMGNLNLQGEIETELAIEDLFHLRLDQARARASHLEALGLEGTAGARINRVLARIQEFQGQIKQAQTSIQAAMKAIPAKEGGANSEQISSACAGLRLSRYAGDAGDGTDWASLCASAKSASDRFDANWALAWVALLGDQTETASTHYQAARDLLTAGQATPEPHSPDARAAAQLQLAFLALRLGDLTTAEQLLQQVQELNEGEPLVPMRKAMLFVALAEAAAARGDWTGSAGWAAKARADLPAGAGELLDRLDLLQIAGDQRDGQSSKSIATAGALYDRAERRGDLRTQQQVLSLVPARVLGLSGEAMASAKAASSRLPGANLRWLDSAPSLAVKRGPEEKN